MPIRIPVYGYITSVQPKEPSPLKNDEQEYTDLGFVAYFLLYFNRIGFNLYLLFCGGIVGIRLFLFFYLSSNKKYDNTKC